MTFDYRQTIHANVSAALQEDIGDGDITGALLPDQHPIKAQVISREPAVICGIEWFDAVFHAVDDSVVIRWQVSDGDQVTTDTVLCLIEGNARSVLTAERAALNFLQTLSGTATTVRHYTQLIRDHNTQILDTRKTIPGLRYAQKYAAHVGGAKNHRIGLFDAILIKENHIIAAGSIPQALKRAHEIKGDRWVEIEVESLGELKQAISGNPDVIMLDNFSMDDLVAAVEINNKRCKLEASGNVNETTITDIAATGVDYISIGALTKHLQAIDLSLRIRQ